LLLHDHLLNSVLQSFRSIMEQNYLGRNNLGKIAQNVDKAGGFLPFRFVIRYSSFSFRQPPALQGRASGKPPLDIQ
jgi:hypothetical protein